MTKVRTDPADREENQCWCSGTLHPTASGRVYAAYGGVYIAVALLWLWKVDRVPMTRWDLAGGAVALAGMGIIVWGGWRTS
jgi:small multidrug resistance family-3 protein